MKKSDKIIPGRKRVQVHFTQPSLTKQSFAKDTNINSIMSRYEKTGLITHTQKNSASYGDFSETNSYQESLNQIMLAQNMFDSLPATIRKQFENEPILFLEFCENPDNKQKMIDMGLLDKPDIPVQPEQQSKEVIKEKEKDS